MENILSGVSTFVTNAITWMLDVVDVVVAQPILFIFVVGVPLVGLGVGLLNRLIRVN